MKNMVAVSVFIPEMSLLTDSWQLNTKTKFRATSFAPAHDDIEI